MFLKRYKIALSGFLFLYAFNLYGSDEMTSILFIGNSHTYVNNLPQIVKRIADSKEDAIEVSQSAMGGYKFYQHVPNQQTLQIINERKWDYVVLQEGIYSTLPNDLAKDQSYPFALMLKDKIRAICPDTKLVLYMVQSYQYGTSYRCPEDPVVCTYEGMYSRLMENNYNIGNLIDADMAPCTVIWDEIRNTDSSLQLWADDYYHPSPLGSYISACAIYATIFKKDLKNVYIPPDIHSETARLIHDKVNEIILDDSSGWNKQVAVMPNFIPYSYKKLPALNVNLNKPFSYQIDPYTFIDDDTLTYTAYLSDGNDLPEWLTFDAANRNFSGTPAEESSFAIVVTATDNYLETASDTFNLTIKSSPTDKTDMALNDQLTIYPNPNSGQFTISGTNQLFPAELRIYNFQGKLVFSKTIQNRKIETISMAGYPKGIYMIKLSNDIVWNKKIVIN